MGEERRQRRVSKDRGRKSHCRVASSAQKKHLFYRLISEVNYDARERVFKPHTPATHMQHEQASMVGRGACNKGCQRMLGRGLPSRTSQEEWLGYEAEARIQWAWKFSEPALSPVSSPVSQITDAAEILLVALQRSLNSYWQGRKEAFGQRSLCCLSTWQTQKGWGSHLSSLGLIQRHITETVRKQALSLQVRRCYHPNPVTIANILTPCHVTMWKQSPLCLIC